MTIHATAGSRLYIGIAKSQKSADFIRSDFSAANATTWKEIKELEGLGSLGDTAEAINFAAVGEQRQKTLKGVRSAGTMEVVCGIDYADEGQQAAIAAERTPHDYEFRLVFNDAPPGGTPSERFFIAKVMSQSEAYDQANSVMKLNLTLAVNSNVVRVDADEA